MEQTTPGKIIITHALLQGEIVRNEIWDLDFTVIEADKLHIETKGSLLDTVRLNLCLRTAHRVLYHIRSFNASSLHDLYTHIKKIHWEEIIPLDGYFSVNSFVRMREIKDFRIVNLKVKDAIADRFMTRYKKRPDSGKENNRAVIFLHWSEGICQVYLDTSGESLSRHGYRKHSWKAPLSESLAAGIIYSMKWKKEDTLINPMCGSGTLAIEAAMMASDRYPGLYRKNYALHHIQNPPLDEFSRVRDELRNKIKNDINTQIIASDINREAVRQARMNAREADVEPLIRFEVRPFHKTTIPGKKGAIVLNPGYGSRMGDEKKLESVYREIGDFFKQKAGGHMGYVFTGNLSLAKKIGLRTKRRIPFMNGNIECRLLEYELYEGSRK